MAERLKRISLAVPSKNDLRQGSAVVMNAKRELLRWNFGRSGTPSTIWLLYS